jgi:hypothetical protein
MVWSIRLVTSEKVSEHAVETVLADGWPLRQWGKQSWGWSAGVYIHLEDGQVRLSGSYNISGYLAPEAVRAMKAGLEKRGHVVRIVTNDFSAEELALPEEMVSEEPPEPEGEED